MRQNNVFLYFLVFLGVLVFASPNSSMASPSDSKVMETEAIILSPGMASSCGNDFVVENLDNRDAELQVVLGNEEFLKDKIQGNDAKAYGLHGSLTEAMLKGKSVQSDDIATIYNIGEKSNIRLHCVE